MFAIIVAMDENHLIGKGNELPWHYKEDMVYFKETTLNHSVLMGYNTYLSILPRNPHMLKNRTNLVLTSHKDLVKEAIKIDSLDDFITLNKDSSNLIFIIGGRRIYETLLPYCKYLYITKIRKNYTGDVYFPKFNEEDYHIVKEVNCSTNCDLSFMIYERNQNVF